MPEARLHTLVHISDLHFGVPPASAAGCPPTFWRHLSYFDGWLGHNDSALAHLEDYMIDLQPEDPTVVVTGDLTACGKVAEFALSKQYLEDEIALPFRRTGLRSPTVMAKSISGNHDQWPGSRRVIGSPTGGLRATFPGLPFPPVKIELDHGIRLAIYGIDSDADIRPFGLQRGLARGEFVSQLQALEGLIGPRPHDEVRVLLLHHSPAYSGSHVLVVNDRSLRALWKLVERCQISVLLTGHIHRPLARVKIVSHRGLRWPVLEARCGTTTQTDELPLNWIAEGTIDPQRLPRNSLLIHRLVWTGRRVEWRTELACRGPAGFIKPIRLMNRPVPVWPL